MKKLITAGILLSVSALAANASEMREICTTSGTGPALIESCIDTNAKIVALPYADKRAQTTSVVIARKGDLSHRASN